MIVRDIKHAVTSYNSIVNHRPMEEHVKFTRLSIIITVNFIICLHL